MKINCNNPDFVPFTFEITVESKAELLALWHRFNFSTNCIVPTYFKTLDSTVTNIDCDDTGKIWIELDIRVKELKSLKV